MIPATQYCEQWSRRFCQAGTPAWRRNNGECVAKAGRSATHSWKGAEWLLEQWREDLRTLTVELKQARVIDAVPINLVSGEPVERDGKPITAFRGQPIYFTNADLTIRRPFGTILVIDRYEIITISDGKKRLEPR